MSTLAEKIRKAREFRIEAGGHLFTVRRPTELEMVELQAVRAAAETEQQNARALRAIIPFIVGWQNVTELDLWSGGTGAPAPFDAEACAEWLTDRVDLLLPIAKAAIDAYWQHREKQAAAVKN